MHVVPSRTLEVTTAVGAGAEWVVANEFPNLLAKKKEAMNYISKSRTYLMYL
jgi:hypothetical protein